MTIHNFQHSQNKEKASTALHDNFYHNLKYTNCSVSKIDRDSCAYETAPGKLYQQADTDCILEFIHFSTQKTIQKKISEKVRFTNYPDVLLEVISVFKTNSNKKDYEIEQEGWALKKETPESPDYLSYLICGPQHCDAILISDYKDLKERLFHKSKVADIIKSAPFIQWLNDSIQARGEKLRSFKTRFDDSKFCIDSSLPQIDAVIFALNRERQNHYYTISFVYSKTSLKKVCKLLEKQISVAPHTSKAKIN